MPIPDANRVVATDEKVRDDLLNLGHPDGGSKVVWFHSLGYAATIGTFFPPICSRSQGTATASIPNPPATIGHSIPGRQMMIAEHSLVVLDSDPTHDKLTRGDVGTVVHVYKDGKGYEVEFVDGGGQTVALVTVGANDVRPIKAGELLHTRTTA